jgi:hypothetical protein
MLSAPDPDDFSIHGAKTFKSPAPMSGIPDYFKARRIHEHWIDSFRD